MRCFLDGNSSRGMDDGAVQDAGGFAGVRTHVLMGGGWTIGLMFGGTLVWIRPDVEQESREASLEG